MEHLKELSEKVNALSDHEFGLFQTLLAKKGHSLRPLDDTTDPNAACLAAHAGECGACVNGTFIQC